MRCVRALLLLHVVFLVVAACPAVEAAGRDRTLAAGAGCTGVAVKPGSAIQKLVDRRPKGTTFCFAPGLYRLRQPIIPKSHDRLIGSRGSILSGAKRLTGFVRSGGFWVADQQAQQGTVSTDLCEPSGYTGCRYPEGVYIDRHPLLQVTSLDELRAGRFYFDYSANKIFIAKDPRGHHVEASVAEAAVAGFSGYQDHVTVAGFVIEMFASPPERLPAAVKPGTGWIVRNNEIRLNHRLGVFAAPGTIISGNDIHDNGQAGVKGTGNSVHVTGNLVRHNNVERFAFWSSAGVRFTGTRHLLVRGNRVIGNVGPGIKTDTDNVDVLIERNTVIGNRGPGIVHEKGYAAIIRHNVVKNNDLVDRGLGLPFGANIAVVASRDVEIYGNTVYSSVDVNGIALIDQRAGSGSLGAHVLKRDHVHDNVLWMTSGVQTGVAGPRTPAEYRSMGDRFRGNVYHLRLKSAEAWRYGGIFGWRGWRRVGNDRDGRLLAW